jgi:hypothetical protein
MGLTTGLWIMRLVHQLARGVAIGEVEEGQRVVAMAMEECFLDIPGVDDVLLHHLIDDHSVALIHLLHIKPHRRLFVLIAMQVGRTHPHRQTL